MIKTIDTSNITFEMEQAYMLNRGAKACIKAILLASPEVSLQDCVVLRHSKPISFKELEDLKQLKLSEGL